MINVRRMGRAALRCSVAVLVLVPAIASADAGAVTDPLTLAGAIALALERNPDLAASAYDLLAAEGCVTQSGVLPNPEFSVDLENFGTRTEERGEAALEATLGLSQVLELGGKRRGHVGVAMAEGLGRESLYKVLAKGGNPSFATVDKVLKALGVKLAIAVLRPEERAPDFKSLLLSTPSGKKLLTRRRGGL